VSRIPTGYARPKLGSEYGKGQYQEIGWQQSNKVLADKYSDIPSYQQWLTDSANQKFPPVENLLLIYPQAPTSFAKYYILNDLFWEIDNGLRSRMPSGEPDPLFDLYKVVVSKLCEFFEVSVNVLPSKLKQFFPKMNREYAKEDKRGYLTDATREEFRLLFENGRIWRRINKAVIPANTNDHDLRAMVSISPDGVELEAGYVLSLWDEFYMRLHTMADPDDPRDATIRQAHSQYMAGEPVACAGEMTIVNGSLKAVSNTSGHYKPPGNRLIQVLWSLQKKGINLGPSWPDRRENIGVWVYALECEVRGMRIYKCRAMDFLLAGGQIGKLKGKIAQDWPF
jgi:hypothetical protein